MRRFLSPSSTIGFTQPSAFIRTKSKLATDEWYEELDATGEASARDGWGEIGLDYYYDHSPRDVQQSVFRRQLIWRAPRSCPSSFIAATRGPIACEFSSRTGVPAGLGGIFHCFTGTLDEAQHGIDMGFMVSFSANITYPKMAHLRDTRPRCRSTTFSRKPIRHFCRRSASAESATSLPLSWR